MRRALSPLRLLAIGVGLLVVVFLILWQVRSGDFLLLPDPAHPVAPLVTVQGGKESTGRGAIYFVDVLEQRASLLDKLFPGLHEGATLVPASAVVPPGTSDATAQRINLRMMAMSQKIAPAVALRALGYHVIVRQIGVLVDGYTSSRSPSLGKLQPTDLIVSLDGGRVRAFADLHRALAKLEPGDVAHVGVRRGTALETVDVETGTLPGAPKLAALGISVQPGLNITLPIAVKIDAGNVGGPSAGLAFALQVMDELGRDVTHGYRVAATGEIEPNGAVAPIGGVKQKTIGVRKAHADVFLVPAGDNAATARRYANGLRIVAVKSFQQALQKLATLPPKR